MGGCICIRGRFYAMVFRGPCFTQHRKRSLIARLCLVLDRTYRSNLCWQESFSPHILKLERKQLYIVSFPRVVPVPSVMPAQLARLILDG